MFLYAWRTCFISTPSNSPSFHSQCEGHEKNEPAWSSHYPFSPRRPPRLVEIVMTCSCDASGAKKKKNERNLFWALAVPHMGSHMSTVSLSLPILWLWSASPHLRRRGGRSHFRLTLMRACVRASVRARPRATETADVPQRHVAR